MEYRACTTGKRLGSSDFLLLVHVLPVHGSCVQDEPCFGNGEEIIYGFGQTEFPHYLQGLYQTSLGIRYTNLVTLPTQRYRLPGKSSKKSDQDCGRTSQLTV